MAYLSTPKRSYQVCHGIWNPAESAYSWIVSSDHVDLNEARGAFRELERNGSKPLALVQVDTRLIERVTAEGERLETADA